MKDFNIPFHYQSSFIKRIKAIRDAKDKLKKDFTPSLLSFDNLEIHLARHFGFCFGVQNAVERAYQIIEENPTKRIFLISEIIHNPEVNANLKSKGLRFIQKTNGEQLIPWDELSTEDIVLIPAFGTTKEIEQLLKDKQIFVTDYNTTCPFVERVWNKSAQLSPNYTIVIHGTPGHEETRATFSQASENGKAIVISDFKQAQILSDFILGKGVDERDWKVFFESNTSKDFDYRTDLDKIAVVNQTTMLANETQKISDYLKDVMEEKFGTESINEHFGSTRDTLCYATNDNQNATQKLLASNPDLTIVVGGENSSNTTHLVELTAASCPTYFISSAKDLEDEDNILHYSLSEEKRIRTKGYLPKKEKLKIALTSGASCPDSTMEAVLLKLVSFVSNSDNIDAAITTLEKELDGL